MPETFQGDISLLARIAQRDPQAFETFYERHARQVFSLALALLRDRTSAVDLTQEVFLLVWRHAGGYRPTGSPRSWLLRLTRNRAIDELRRQRRCLQDDPPSHNNMPQILHAPPALTNVADRRAIREAVDALPTAQREALVLAFFHGMTHQEIAKRLQAPLGTVKARIRRAMQTLRQQFGGKENVS
jgi:RNA polymerase sigma-70 factor (ECF subfamily)